MSQCQKLYEYAFLIDQIRKQLAAGKQLKAAVDYAVEFCIREEILADFLRRHRAEVTRVILTEYDQERHIRNEKQTSYEEGHREGHKEGHKEGSILTTVRICRQFGRSDEEICKALVEELGLSEEEAKEWI